MMRKVSAIVKSFMMFENEAEKLKSEHIKKTSLIIELAEKAVKELQERAENIVKESEAELQTIRSNIEKEIDKRFEESKVSKLKEIQYRGKKNFEKAVEEVYTAFLREFE